MRECLDSILNQKLEDLEIILIDDGGQDNCPNIIDEYSSKDERIIAIHKENRGYGHSCNVGLNRATGEYISIIEPDDYIDENMYFDLYPLAKENDVDIIKTPFIQNFFQNGVNIKQTKMPNHKEFIKPEGVTNLKESPWFMHIHPSIWSCLYKRTFLNDNNIRFIEAPGAGWTDNPFQVQTMCLAKRIYYHDYAYYYWRVFSWNDLKDYKIPFLRTKEIHEWLDNNKLFDEGILSYLCMRECVYFKMINDIIDFKDIQNYKNLFAEYYQYNKKSIEESKILPFKNKLFLNRMKDFLLFMVIHNKIKNFRRKIISVQLNKRHQYFSVLGNYVLGGKYD